MPTILVQTRPLSQKMKRALLPSALAVLLSACNTSLIPIPNMVTDSLKEEAYASSEYYINQADKSLSKESQQSYRLLAVRKLIEENKIVEAQNLVFSINPLALNEEQRNEFDLVSAQLAAADKNNAEAIRLLKKLPQGKLSRPQLFRVYLTKSRIAENDKDPIATMRARSLMNSYITDNNLRQENNDKIWETLRNANRGMLEQASASPGEIELAGWLALSTLYKQYILEPTELPKQIENWKNEYPNHSAALVLPTELKRLSGFRQTELKRLALLLPLSGESKVLGDMIKKGFDDAKGNDTRTLQLYDTNMSSIQDILEDAKQKGIETVIGPLFKSKVDELLVSSEIGNFNILALNATPNARNIAQVCYYGLSPEAEARSGAEKLHKDNIDMAVVIAPQDDFGQRSAEAFAQRWRQLTYRDADVRYYYNPAESISMLQNIQLPNNTALYLLGNAQQLIELKQEIDRSSISGRYPIYTSSRSNSPNNGLDFRFAMEGVKFSEIPLLADETSLTYKTANHLAERDFSMMRLYAMGSDAWSIVNKFNEFRQISGYKVSGLTGILSAGQYCNIEREMSWLKYQNGSIVPAQ